MTLPQITAPLDHTRTKIVCTIGPSSSLMKIITEMVLAGADVFRLNFSHGTHEDHEKVIRKIRRLCQDEHCPFAILGDLSGPKIRLGEVANGGVEIPDSATVCLTSEKADGSDNRFQVNVAGFHELANKGEEILLDDGKIRFVVDRIDGSDVYCQATNGGLLKSRKGVNLPDTRLPFPALTDKDHADMKFALENGVDMLALSFVRSPEDIVQAREAMNRLGYDKPILAKIEKKEAVGRLEEIIQVSNGIMVARGDLGIEIPMEQVPAVQKRLIHLCNKYARPVITATQMLESMMTNPRPTRAEVTDVYNAILDGTDAVMLSGETAAGEHPVEAVKVMSRVAREAEKAIRGNQSLRWVLDEGEKPTTTHVTCHAAVHVAEELDADLIIVPTWSGRSARQLSRFKPSVPVFACSTELSTVRQLCLAWGVTARAMENVSEEESHSMTSDTLIQKAIRSAIHHGHARPGMRAVVIGGTPWGESKSTNYLRIVEIQ